MRRACPSKSKQGHDCSANDYKDSNQINCKKGSEDAPVRVIILDEYEGHKARKTAERNCNEATLIISIELQGRRCASEPYGAGPLTTSPIKSWHNRPSPRRFGGHPTRGRGPWASIATSRCEMPAQKWNMTLTTVSLPAGMTVRSLG